MPDRPEPRRRGRGFDPSKVPDGHLGLTGMRARAERLGGRLTVTSTPGNGTLIEVVVPESVPVEALRPDCPPAAAVRPCRA